MANDINLYEDMFKTLSLVELEFPGYEKRKYRKIPFEDIAFEGSLFAFISSEIKKTKQKAPDDIYKVIIPGGKGRLREFNDGSGLSGIVVNEKGKIIEQARLIKVDSLSDSGVLLSSVSAVAAVSVAYYVFKKNVLEIKNQLNNLEQILMIQDEAKLESAYRDLVDLFDEYPLVLNNKDLLNAKHQKVLDYLERVSQLITQHKRTIVSILNSPNFNKGTVDKLDYYLQYYLLSIKVYSMAVFLEILYSENYNHLYILKKKNDILKLKEEFHQILNIIDNSPHEYFKQKSEKYGKRAELVFPYAGEGIGCLIALVPSCSYSYELKKRVAILKQNEKNKEYGIERFDLLECIANTDYGYFLDENYLYLIADANLETK